MSRRGAAAIDLASDLPAIASASAGFKPAALFTAFCAQIGVVLEPGQRVAALVAFDGVQPKDLEPADREIARELFGDIDEVSPNVRRIFGAVCGARGGKTYVFGALRLLHLALTVPIHTLAPGEVASGPLIAPDMDLATQALRYAQGAIAAHPALAAMVEGKPDAAESIELRRDGRIVEIVVRSASGRGRTGRGRSLFGAVMEEAAFFYDKDHAVNDEEIFRAITPRLLPGAQLIVSSTPWAQLGLIYDLFVGNHPNPKCAGVDELPKRLFTALVMHAATTRLRDTPFIRDMVASERALDPDNAAREYDAQFMSASVDTFFDPITLAKCIDNDLEIPFLPDGGDEVASGGDLGFSKNSSALVVTHRRTVLVDAVAKNLISVADIREKKPQEGAALEPSKVVREFADVIVEHHGSCLMADGHYKATAIEHLGAARLGFLEAPAEPAEAFIATRTVMREGRVRIPNHPRLVRQLRETMCRRGSGGKLTIILRRWRTGEHGDIAAAFVLAVYQQAGERVPAAKPAPGTPEAFEAEAAEQRERRRDTVRRKNERGGSFTGRWPGR